MLPSSPLPDFLGRYFCCFVSFSWSIYFRRRQTHERTNERMNGSRFGLWSWFKTTSYFFHDAGLISQFLGCFLVYAWVFSFLFVSPPSMCRVCLVFCCGRFALFCDNILLTLRSFFLLYDNVLLALRSLFSLCGLCFCSVIILSRFVSILLGMRSFCSLFVLLFPAMYAIVLLFFFGPYVVKWYTCITPGTHYYVARSGRKIRAPCT